MILEGIVTTLCDDSTVNISPMGPVVGQDLSRFELRPFDTSLTFANLQREKMGVLHVTDDVELFARAAIHHFDIQPQTRPAEKVNGAVLTDACRWYEFRVTHIQQAGHRANLQCQTVHQVNNREFFGFNRAKHAVIEAAILATRASFLPAQEVDAQLQQLKRTVEKTGGSQEKLAFDLLHSFVMSCKMH